VALNRTGQLQMFKVTTSGLPACTQPPTFHIVILPVSSWVTAVSDFFHRHYCQVLETAVITVLHICY